MLIGKCYIIKRKLQKTNIVQKTGRNNGNKKVLLIGFGGIGDMVLMTPMLQALTEAIPGVSVDVITKSKYVDFFKTCPLVNCVIKYPGNRRVYKWVGKPSTFVTSLYRQYDITIGCCEHFGGTCRWFTGKALSYLIDANMRIGTLDKLSRKYFRISKYFLNAGLGFGGSCLPKDTKALIAKAKEVGYEPSLLKAVLSVNTAQIARFLEIAREKTGGLKGKTVAVLGLAFKPGTDDVRESPALSLLNALVKEGARVRAYDPEAVEEMKKELSDVEYCKSADDALKGAELCLLVTDWPEFKDLDFSIMKAPLVIEGRKLLGKKHGADIEGICW